MAAQQKISVKQVRNNVPDMWRQAMTLGRVEVLVGVPEKTTNREQRLFAALQRTKPGSTRHHALRKAWVQSLQGMTNATIAYIQDTGSPAANIPARPFMQPGIKAEQRAITDYLGQAGRAAMTGNWDLMNRCFTAAGLAAQRGIRARINSNIPPPLAPRTLRARQRMGFPGTKTLVMTGQLRNAINFIIRKVTGEG